MASPSSWKSYLTKSKGQKKNKLEAFSRFRARYYLASEINPIKVSGMRESTQDGYSAALRVTLAYTALEALEVAIGNSGQTEFSDEKILEYFWNSKNDHFVHEIVETYDKSSRYFKALKSFQEGESIDLRPLAYGIRNLMAHGTLTANRLQLSESKKRRRAINDLADLILKVTDDRFTEYVRKMKVK